MAGRLAGKVAVITGAGGGIGRATALRMAEEGAAVVANDVTDGLAETVGLIERAGGTASAARGDVTQPATNTMLCETATRRYGALDIFHCNAGGARPIALLDIDLAEYERQMALNLHAVWHGTQAALRVMVEQQRGVILTTTSGAGLGATWGLAPYGAAKAGVISLMRNVALEFGKQGIRAATISPGAMASEGMLDWLETMPGGPEAYGRKCVAGRLGNAREIAEAAVFLASDEASYINGICLPVDGGTSAVLASPSSNADDA